MIKESLIYKIMKWLGKWLGIVKTYEVNKQEMCESAKHICNKKCEGCAWRNH